MASLQDLALDEQEYVELLRKLISVSVRVTSRSRYSCGLMFPLRLTS
jgi:hypothetical protein